MGLLGLGKGYLEFCSLTPNALGLSINNEVVIPTVTFFPPN